MYYGKDVLVCESKSRVLVSLKRIFRLFKKFGECTVNLSNWYSGWIRYIRYKCLRYLLKADLLIKNGKKLYPSQFYRLPLGVGTLRNQSLIGFFEILNRPIKCGHVTMISTCKMLLNKMVRSLCVFGCCHYVFSCSLYQPKKGMKKRCALKWSSPLWRHVSCARLSSLRCSSQVPRWMYLPPVS